MTSRHYDVVVLGRSLGALAAAALLARRDFRVLLLGQGEKPASYRFEGRRLRRRAFTFLSGTSPVFRRILHELAQTQTFKRYTRALDPMFGVSSPSFRLEVPPDVEQFQREVEREFPEVQQVVNELYATIGNVNALADATFERDLMWPPGTVWERFETGRAASTLPLLEHATAEDLLGKFPAGHAYRDLLALPASFATDLAHGGPLHPFALARLHGAWTRGVVALEGGEDALEEFFVERIEAHGGICALNSRARSIVVRRGTAIGILEDGEEDVTGAGAILCDRTGETLAELSGGEGITRAAQRDWPRLSAHAGRFVTSFVVDRRGLPDPLPTETFLLPDRRTAAPDPRRPAVHLQRLEGKEGPEKPGESLLVAECLLPKRGPLTLYEARQALVRTVFEHLPFLERHLKLVDSPHDGLPLYDYTSGTRREIDRIHVRDGTPGPEPMDWLWSVEPAGYLGLAGEPVRGPIPGTYLVGSTVMPGLGQEGALLAAWSAARLITRKDRTRQKMRREMWSKFETS